MASGTGRLLCLGDSFTFGEGVGNRDTWCSLLGDAAGGRETVNLGESGYGIDQTFLKYRLYADSLDHSVVLLTFIADDFRREFGGAGAAAANAAHAVGGCAVGTARRTVGATMRRRHSA